ncbi:DUF692 domain-containing protein [Burkholderiaceae bacterium DAT-1]|nr:DUF692 domain-containing protein [Burkholderiaceae bacterium DAT-1]
MNVTLPRLAGLGLRSPHVHEVEATLPAVSWWEVHSENYFGGGAPLAALERVRARYPVSLHGVRMGLGNVQPPDPHHLAQLVALVQHIEPAAVSEHLAWNRCGERWFNDLLPVPGIEAALAHLSAHIQIVQDTIKRPLLIENVSAYVRFADADYSEAEMLAELVARTGCGLLLDLNNLYVNQLNFGLDARRELAHLPLHAVGEIHVAGHETFGAQVIDTHGSPVCAAVYDLLADVLRQTGPLPVLLERDSHLPSLPELLTEYQQLAAVVRNALSTEEAIA